METRRVQITGGSSYVITLPKGWIKQLKIKKNDQLGIINKPDGTLQITSKLSREQTQTNKEFEITRRTNQTYLLRRLIGAYIAGYNYIRLKSKERMPLPIRITTRKFTQIAIGQEVVEETDYQIIIKDLLNPSEMPFSSTIKRMHIIVKGMYVDIIRALETKDKRLIEDAINRDNDVDRLHLLIARQHNTILQNVSLAEKMNVSIKMSSTFFLISRIMERIGDHVVRIAQNVNILSNKKIDRGVIEKIQQASNLSLKIFNESISSFFRKDIESANENIEKVGELEKDCEEINTLALKEESITATSIGYIVGSIRRIGEYSEDISENIINFLVSEEK